MASISTGTLTVNAAFFQEIKEVNQDLWRTLAQALGMVDAPAEILADPTEFVELCESLRDQLALHFALEEAYGYFEDPVHVAPQLCDRAVALRSEHRELYLEMCNLGDQACDLLMADRISDLIPTLAHDFHEFDRKLRLHEALENRLIMQEYTDDIGVGD